MKIELNKQKKGSFNDGFFVTFSLKKIRLNKQLESLSFQPWLVTFLS